MGTAAVSWRFVHAIVAQPLGNAPAIVGEYLLVARRLNLAVFVYLPAFGAGRT